MGKMAARLGERLGADMTGKIGLIRQVSEERIEFALNAGLESGEHGRDQDRKGQKAAAEKGGGGKAGGFEKFAGMKIVRKPDKNALVLRWASLFNLQYQWITGVILS